MHNKNCKTTIVFIKLVTLWTFVSISSGFGGLTIFGLGIAFKIYNTEHVLNKLPKKQCRNRSEKCFYKISMYLINYAVFQFTIKPALNELSIIYFDSALARKYFLIILKEYVVNDAILHVHKLYQDAIDMSCDHTSKTEIALISKGIIHFITSLYHGHKYEKFIDIIRVGALNELVFAWKSDRINFEIEIVHQKITSRIGISTANELIHKLLLRNMVSATIKLIDAKLILIPEVISQHIITTLSCVLCIATRHAIKSFYSDNR